MEGELEDTRLGQDMGPEILLFISPPFFFTKYDKWQLYTVKIFDDLPGIRLHQIYFIIFCDIDHPGRKKYRRLHVRFQRVILFGLMVPFKKSTMFRNSSSCLSGPFRQELEYFRVSH